MSARRPSEFARSLVARLLLFVPVAFLVWFILTPFYNLFLKTGTQNLVRLSESPNVSRLELHETHYMLLERSDFKTEKGFLYSLRVTDVHFNWVLILALFLATPGVSARDRFSNLGWAALITVCFHLLSLFFYVKFAYATQLGSWSLAHYGPFARNLFGLGKHLLDLPFKFALPLLLWCGFYLGAILDRATAGDP